MRNKFPGTCYQCGLPVPAGTGYFERDQKAHIWKVQHRECCWRFREKARLTSPSILDAKEGYIGSKQWAKDSGLE